MRIVGLVNTGTAKLAVTQANTQGSIAINSTALKLSNIGSAVCFVRIGVVAQTAVTSDTCLAPGENLIVARQNASTIHVAAICETSATTSLFVSNLSVNV